MLLNELISGADVDTEISVPELDENVLKNLFVYFGNIVRDGIA